jgi:leucyl aminopeptidase
VGAAVARGVAIADAVSMARDLVSEPASVLNPEEMANRARAVAAEHGLEITVMGPEELTEMGAGAITAVGKGSASGPRLIHLIYRPEGGSASDRQVGLVGKCITFDTGGYSIKTSEGMLQMKTDMAGGAAVLGTMTALKALGVRETVHGVICAAENMISGEAFRPGDILTALNGVTIEVLSTDAEGRLVLADGLVYTARQGATELIDLATLTGAAVVALGESTTALFASDDDLADRILDASEVAGEHTWRMPLTPALNEKIRGDVGDIKNTGGRGGGAITAALFLERFREGLPWAHLDIAGPARVERSTAYTPKGASGTGVRTLLAYLDRS